MHKIIKNNRNGHYMNSKIEFHICSCFKRELVSNNVLFLFKLNLHLKITETFFNRDYAIYAHLTKLYCNIIAVSDIIRISLLSFRRTSHEYYKENH